MRFLPLFLYGLPVLFLAIVALQVVPLPEGILGVLSPARLSLNNLVRTGPGSPVSIAPRATWLWLLRTTSLVLVFAAASTFFASRRNVFFIAGLVVVFGYLLALYGILQYVSGGALPVFFKPRPGGGAAAGTYVNSNHFAGYLEMCIPLALSVVFVRGRRDRSIRSPGRKVVDFLSEKLQDRRFLLPLAAAVVMGLAVVFSMSRMGLFSLVVSLAVFFILVGKRHALKVRAAILGAVVAAILLGSTWLGMHPVLQQFSLLTGKEVPRLDAWKMTARIAGDYPVLGTGLGTYGHISGSYQTPGAGTGRWEQAHNDYLNLLSDTGVVGFAVAMAFLAAWYVYVLRLLAGRDLRSYQRSIAAGCVAGVTAVVIHSIADFNLQIPANAFYFAVLMGLAVSVLRTREFPSPSREGPAERGGSRWVFLRKVAPWVAAAGAAAIILPTATTAIRSESWYGAAMMAHAPEKRAEALENAVAIEPGMYEAHYELGKVRSLRGNGHEQVKKSFEAAVRGAPSVGKCHYRLGIALARLGDDEGAERELGLALRFDRMYADLHYRVAYYHFFQSRRMRYGELVAKAIPGTGRASPGTELAPSVRLLARSLLEFRKVAEIDPAYLPDILNLLEKSLGPYFSYTNLKNAVPDTPGAHITFGNWLARRGRWGSALTEYIRAGTDFADGLKPEGRRRFRLRLGLVLLMNGYVDRAEESYLAALEEPGREHILRRMYSDYQKAGRLREGMEFFAKLAARFPYSHTLQLNIGKAHLALGNVEKAEGHFRKSLGIRESEEALVLRYKVAMTWKEYSLAQVHMKKALAFDRGKAEYHFLLARAMEADGDLKGALRELREAVKLSPGSERYRRDLQRVGEKLLFERK
jgi:O-antigen ligase/tetratricopeptide (TPR) repeat protein